MSGPRMLGTMTDRRTLVLHVQATGTTWVEDVATGRRTPVRDLDDLAGVVRRVLGTDGGSLGGAPVSDVDPGEDPGVHA